MVRVSIPGAGAPLLSINADSSSLKHNHNIIKCTCLDKMYMRVMMTVDTVIMMVMMMMMMVMVMAMVTRIQ